jgi:hypothetical protein
MKKATFHMITGLLAMSLAFGVNFAQAQAGTLDTTFGNGGTVTTSFANGSAGVGSFEQSNGDIAAVAQVDFVDNGGTGLLPYKFLVARRLCWNKSDSCELPTRKVGTDPSNTASIRRNCET